mgnify:CR=1 FL=1
MDGSVLVMLVGWQMASSGVQFNTVLLKEKYTPLM